ncbi:MULTISPECIES: AI-2E family transporter [Bacillaceae]|uniref:AI-2E family transporter n=1 Tax=Metabacillus sediminis TaxID=3117746 RepID=A0ABZ2NJ20_9BACI|nr:AI-2E family transporter [Bacillus sp. SJS]KZZ84403.1 AI-2E family transporter [Bacillus sp. SJS]
MPDSKYFRLGYTIIILLVIIMLAVKVQFIFTPLVIIFQTLFFPFLISGVIFYLFRPIVLYLDHKKVPKTLSIVVLYILFIGIGTLLFFLIGPEIQKQFKTLIDNAPGIIETLQSKANEIRQSSWMSRFEENSNMTVEQATAKISDYFKSNVSNIGNGITGLIGILSSLATIIVTVPFIVFYLLKDSEGLSTKIARFFPLKANESKKILKDMDSALSSYIQGQAIICLIVGIMMYIGYLIIGVNYSLILAIVAMFTNVIPFIGPFLAIIPALIIGFIDSPFMAVKVLIVAIIVQQIDGNVSSPLIMGRKLDIHPLTIILLLLVAGSMGGLLFMILAVPVYAVLKVIVSHIYRLYQLHKIEKKQVLKIEED